MKAVRTCLRSTFVALIVACATTGGARAQEVVVDEFIEIPPVKEEMIAVEPEESDLVWIDGYWERDPGKWVWENGRWEKPPHKKARWKNGQWKWKDAKWHWNRGHWAIDDVAWIVDETIDIPLTIPESKPAKPGMFNHWVAGYWDWDAGWFWIPGYWTTKPDPKAVWVPGHWEPWGADGYWWMGGHWRVN